MNIRTLKLASFSPTGTTRTVLGAIGRGIGARPEVIDITLPAARSSSLSANHDDLLVLGVPVYMGRIPDLLSDWLKRLELDRTPTVCVVVYGNRAYESALRELRDVVSSRGGIPVAGAAFIGEHSFSSAELPASAGRPDAGDLRFAEEFGRDIGTRLRALSEPLFPRELSVPGTFPYGGVTKLWDVDFVHVAPSCTHCGACAEHCPTGAIDSKDSASIDIVKCVTCCACIKVCPERARQKKPGPVMEASRRIHSLYPDPKRPELFFATV